MVLILYEIFKGYDLQGLCLSNDVNKLYCLVHLWVATSENHTTCLGSISQFILMDLSAFVNEVNSFV